MHWKSSHNQLTLKVVFFSHNHWEIPMNLLKKIPPFEVGMHKYYSIALDDLLFAR